MFFNFTGFQLSCKMFHFPPTHPPTPTLHHPHLCQLSRIIRESPWYRSNLSVSRTGDQISRIRRKLTKMRVFTLIFTDFSEKIWNIWCIFAVFTPFLWLTRVDLEAKLAVSWISIFFGWHFCTPYSPSTPSRCKFIIYTLGNLAARPALIRERVHLIPLRGKKKIMNLSHTPWNEFWEWSFRVCGIPSHHNLRVLREFPSLACRCLIIIIIIIMHVIMLVFKLPGWVCL